MRGTCHDVAFRAAAVAVAGTVLTVLAPAAVVENSNDEGPGSLRQAIADAAPGEVITFAPHLGGATIALVAGQLTLERDLAIDASALSRPLRLDAGAADGPERVLEVARGATVVLDSLIISGGTTTDGRRTVEAGNGGGIYNAGSLTLRNTTVSNNSTGGGGTRPRRGGAGGLGGGIYNKGVMLIEDSIVRGNATGDGGVGEGYDGDDWDYGWTDWDSGWLDTYNGMGGPGGAGGGICNVGTLTMRRAVVSHNLTGEGGYGFRGDYPSRHDDSIASGGTGGPGAAVYSSGTLVVEECSFSDNLTGRGGDGRHIAGAGGAGSGLYQCGGTVLVERSAISGNRTGASSRFGGSGAGIFVEKGSMLVRNATIAANTTGYGNFRGGSAAGLYNAGGAIELEHVTLSGNATGEGGTYPGGVGGIYQSSGALTLRNSIVAGNMAAQGEVDLEIWTGELVKRGENLVGGDPMLMPLANNGGATLSMEPRPGSPVIDAGGVLSGGSEYDQRGWPRVAGDAPDLGAVEWGESMGYAAWAAAMIPDGKDASFNGDANGNGVSNGLEYGCGSHGNPVVSFGAEGARISFGYRVEAEVDLVWRVLRSTDLNTFTEILRLENGQATMAGSDQLSYDSGGYALLDSDPPAGAAFYRLVVELAK